MPTTLSNLPFVRRTAIGVSASAQGADATEELARSALLALRSARWIDNAAPPGLPVHDYDRPCPAGDAFKACYGYNAELRSQRSACGAVVYTFTLPSASEQTIEALSAIVTGDRYLDHGVDVHAVLSASATPPTVATLLARTPDATLCATSAQSVAPNARTGVAAPLELAGLGSAQAHLHVALLLHDYLDVRGAWIEGGAMLSPDTLAVTFSGSVTAPARAGGYLVPVFPPITTPGTPPFVELWNAMGKGSNDADAARLAQTVLSGAAPLAAKQLNGGTYPPLLGDADHAGFAVTSPSDHCSDWFCGSISHQTDGYSWVVGCVAHFDAAPLFAGASISIPSGTSSGTLRMRAVAFEIADLNVPPDWTSPEFWSGSSPECIGVVEFAASAGASLVVSRRPDTPFVGISFAPVSGAGSYFPNAISLPVS